MQKRHFVIGSAQTIMIAALLATRHCLPMSASHQPSVADLRQGVIFIVSAMLILPGIDAIAKGLSGSISAGEVAWVRHVLQAIFLFAFALRGGGLRIGSNLWFHIARGVLLATVTVVFFAALSVMPLADAISIFFVSPLMFTLLSAVFLGEPIGWRRISAVLVGLAGSSLIVRPSYAAFGATAFLPIFAAFGFALYMLLTRKLARGGSVANAIGMQFYVGVFGALALTPVLLVGSLTDLHFLAVAMPNEAEWGLLILLGAIATGGHVLVALATRRIGAGQIAPFQYVEIVGATTLGFIFFGDFPDPLTWVGVVVIVSSGLYVYFREWKLAEGATLSS